MNQLVTEWCRYLEWLESTTRIGRKKCSQKYWSVELDAAMPKKGITNIKIEVAVNSEFQYNSNNLFRAKHSTYIGNIINMLRQDKHHSKWFCSQRLKTPHATIYICLIVKNYNKWVRPMAFVEKEKQRTIGKNVQRQGTWELILAHNYVMHI